MWPTYVKLTRVSRPAQPSHFEELKKKLNHHIFPTCCQNIPGIVYLALGALCGSLRGFLLGLLCVVLVWTMDFPFVSNNNNN
jgi:hypothetical protein